MRKPNLGKLLHVGETFYTSTKRMDKRRSNCRMNATFNGPLITYEVLRTGDKRYFTKGKRRYFCEVQGMIELRTGFYLGSIYGPDGYFPPNCVRGNRWWHFTYLVKILEN